MAWPRALRAVLLAGALAGSTLAGCGARSATLDPVTLEQGAAAAGIPAGTLVEIDGSAVGPRINGDKVEVVLFQAGRDPRVIASHSPVRRGTNSVALAVADPIDSAGEWSGYAYGTAGAGVSTVKIGGIDETQGGEVNSGVWLVALRTETLFPPTTSYAFLSPDGRALATGEGAKGSE
jgi:hypothetical protein